MLALAALVPSHAVGTKTNSSVRLLLLLCYALPVYAIIHHSLSVVVWYHCFSVLCYSMPWYATPGYMVLSLTFAWAITTIQSRRVLELHRPLFGCTVFVLPASLIMLCYATLLTAPIYLLTSTCMVLPLTFALVNIVYTAASGMTHMHAVETTNSSSSSSSSSYAMPCYAMLSYITLQVSYLLWNLCFLCYAMLCPGRQFCVTW